MEHHHHIPNTQIANGQLSLMDRLQDAFSQYGFMPHGHCYLWKPLLVYTHVISDLLIGTAYILISITLYGLVKKIQMSFNRVILFFGLFIGACGLTHFFEIWNLWHADYWWSAWIKAITAIASIGTWIYLFRLRHTIVALAESAKMNTLELNRVRDEFTMMANNISQLAWMADEKGNVVWYNQRWYDYTGTTFEDVKNYKWESVHDPHEIERVKKHWIHSIKVGEKWEDTFPLRGADGTYRWFLSRALPIKDEKGKVIKWFGTNTDIDEQLRMNHKLKESEKRLQAVIDNMGEGLVMADSSGKMLLLNSTALQLYGFENMDKAVKNASEYPKFFRKKTLDGKEIPFHDWPISKVLRGETFKNYELLVESIDTGYKWYANYTGNHILDDSGRILLGLLNVRDITYRVKSEKDLKAAINARDEFLSIASHELKTPVTTMLMQAQLQQRLVSKGDEKAYTKERIDQICEQNEKMANRLSRLIDDMLDISRIRSGRLSLSKEKVDLCNIVREVLERLKPQFLQAGYQVPTFEGTEVIGLWDSLRLEQVTNNLLTNALRYGQGKPVEVRVEKMDSRARIYVKDQGIGIAKESQDKIFDRFERDVNFNEVTGLGLGLYILKQIVLAHKGRVWVESELNKGSTFIVELPLQ